MVQSKYRSDLRLIDLLSLRPGALLHVHSIKGELGCEQAEQIAKTNGWQEVVSNVCFPNSSSRIRHNFSKLLDVPIDANVIIRHTNGKVLEILRLEAHTWNTILTRTGHRADVMVNGRVIASGVIIDTDKQSGILIKKVAAH